MSLQQNTNNQQRGRTREGNRFTALSWTNQFVAGWLWCTIQALWSTLPARSLRYRCQLNL